MDEQFAEALGLYVADGKTTVNDMRHLEFSSIDPDIAKFMLDFFTSRMNVPIWDIYIRIRHSKLNEDELKEKWAKALKTQKEKIVVKRYGKNKTDCCEIYINSKSLGVIFEKLITISLDEIQKSPELSRAFLRGHFAADGGFERRRNKNFSQIQYVIFAYHKTKEIWLRDYIINLLKLSGINYIKIRELQDKETAYIRISFWKNFEKIWKMNLFSRSIRKTNTFMNSLKHSSIYLKLDENFHDKLFSSLKMTQKEIAKIIQCKSDGEMSDTIHRKHLLRLEQIDKIIKKTNFSWKDIKNNTSKLRIGPTYFVNEGRLFDFIVNERKLI